MAKHRCLGTRLDNGWQWKCAFCDYEFIISDDGAMNRISWGDARDDPSLSHFGGAGGIEIAGVLAERTEP